MYSKKEVEELTLKYFKGDDLATQVWIKKYCLKDEKGNLLEKSPDDMHRRMAKEFARIEATYPNSLGEEEIYQLFKDFKYVVPGGSPMEGIGNNYKIQSLSNCYVIGNDEDSYASILKIDEEQIHIMRRRGGVGSDLSHLRPRGAYTSCAALSSTGVVPFAERYSNSTRETAMEGRRGARMLSLSIHHPDAEDFIDAKLEKGKITGSNISVKITENFMDAVLNDKDFIQTFPIDHSFTEDLYSDQPFDETIKVTHSQTETAYIKRIKAKRLWNKIIKNAHQSGEPGMLFIDQIQKESPSDCYGADWKSVSSNPCISGDTLIAVADGRNAVSIRQLAEEEKDVPVYATSPETGSIKIKWGRNPRITKKNVEVWKLTLDDGTILIATPDHKIMLKDRSYCELSKLKKGQSLNPFNTYLSEGSWNDGYRCINSKSNGHARQYRMIYEFFNSVYDGKISNVHHKDENRLNDLPENLELRNAKIHRSEHKLGEKNPYHTHDNVRLSLLANGRHPGKENGRYIDISNEEMIEHGKKCLDQFGELTRSNWNKYVDACEVKIPCVHNKFRFNRFSNFKSCVIDNHKVRLVEFYGYEDVYNLTVDDFHNYNIITSGDENFIQSSGITVKNCGEIPMNPYSSCILSALNLYSYVIDPFTSRARFNFPLFRVHANKGQRLIDDIVDLELEKIEQILYKVEIDPESDDTKLREKNLWLKIQQKIKEGRRTGLGITAEGDVLAALGLRYGTKEATEFAVEVHKVIAVESYKASIQMAEERGAFPIWDYEKEKENPFIDRINYVLSAFDEKTLDVYYRYGRRNIANLTIAPVGTGSLMTQSTSGIEPLFQPFYKRRTKTDDKSKAVYVDEMGDGWLEYFVLHPKFIEWWRINNDIDGKILDFESAKELLQELPKDDLQMFFKDSPYYRATANDIDWEESVKMQGAVQKWIDHSISKTVNLPADATIETVDKVYRAAYHSGCKGVTIYRDGCRQGVLLTGKDEKKDSFEYKSSFKRPQRLECDIYHKVALKQDYMIIVGKVNGNPYEIFALRDVENCVFPTKIEKGYLTKVKSRTYELTSEIQGKTFKIANIVTLMTADQSTDTRKYSSMLRHGMHPQHIVDQIDEYASIVSFDKVIQRVLKNYVQEEQKKEKCPECGSENYHIEEGCAKCVDCGHSRCG